MDGAGAGASGSTEVPHVVRNDEGRDVWVLDGTPFSSPGLTAVAGWPEPFPAGPKTYEECPPARLRRRRPRSRYMDEVGIWAQVLYPNVAGFGSQRFLSIRDDELKLRLRAARTTTSSATGRRPTRAGCSPMMSLPFWDIDATVKEITAQPRRRSPRHPLHRRAAALRVAVPRARTTGTRCGRSPQEAGPPGALPHRQRRHELVVRARAHRRATAPRPPTPTRRPRCS